MSATDDISRGIVAVGIVVVVVVAVVAIFSPLLLLSPEESPSDESVCVSGEVTRLYIKKPDRGETQFMVALNSTASYRVAESDWIRIEAGLTVTLEKGDYGVWKLTEALTDG